MSQGNLKRTARIIQPFNNKPFTAISPAQVFEHDGVKFYIIKNKGHVLMRDQFLRGQQSWNAVFQKLIAGEKSLYGTLKELEVQA
jgi:hypothetical protein